MRNCSSVVKIPKVLDSLAFMGWAFPFVIILTRRKNYLIR